MGSATALADDSLTDEVRAEALLNALTTILWRAAAVDDGDRDGYGRDSGAAREVVLASCKGRSTTARHFFEGLATRTVRCSSEAELRRTLRSKVCAESSRRGSAEPEYAAKKGPGVLLFTVSVLLSRGISRVIDDMDKSVIGAAAQGSDGDSGGKAQQLFPYSPLIGDHHYCAQELVNLLTFGLARYVSERASGGTRKRPP